MNFWDAHGLAFVILLAVFPRLTLLLSSVASGGALWWLGWLVAPRILVAVLASTNYWDSNPYLVAFTWAWALLGEGGEKTAASNCASG